MICYVNLYLFVYEVNKEFSKKRKDLFQKDFLNLKKDILEKTFLVLFYLLDRWGFSLTSKRGNGRISVRKISLAVS
jgi:hypothetical protein